MDNQYIGVIHVLDRYSDCMINLSAALSKVGTSSRSDKYVNARKSSFNSVAFGSSRHFAKFTLNDSAIGPNLKKGFYVSIQADALEAGSKLVT